MFAETHPIPFVSSRRAAPYRDKVAIPRYTAPLARHSGRTDQFAALAHHHNRRSEEHTSELQSLMRISYAVFCLKKKKTKLKHTHQLRNIHNNEIVHTKLQH